MPKYVDGYLLPVPKKKLAAYQKMAALAGKVWREHGALEYRECAGDDLKNECGTPFPKLLATKPGETVVFAWVVFKSRAHRDKVNARVMEDPRLKMLGADKMPFDVRRMSWGGFVPIVDLT